MKENDLCESCKIDCGDQAVQILETDDEGISKEVKLDVITTECSNYSKGKK
jgi:hypothetical protein